MDTLMPDLKTFKVCEISDYQINFYIVQNLDNTWVSCFQFSPTLKNASFGLVQNKEFLPKIGTVEKINDLDSVF